MIWLATALALVLGLSSAAYAQTRSPGVTSPFVNFSGLASHDSLPPPLPPRADGTPPDLAFGAYQRGNFLYALLEAERRLDANPKDAAAMTLIGEIYRDGAAVTRDDREASRWYRLASDLGNIQAAYELGALLLQGANGVPQDRPARRRSSNAPRPKTTRARSTILKSWLSRARTERRRTTPRPRNISFGLRTPETTTRPIRTA